MTTFQIRNRLTGNVQFECELPDEVAGSYGLRLGLAVRQAIKAGAPLAGADLANANLAGANLADTNLTDANLTGAYLTRADLAGANLIGTNLTGAYLTRANLAHANLTCASLLDAILLDADLTYTNLTGAKLLETDLTGVNLLGADLFGADLSRAYLATIRSDLWDVLLRARDEIAGLLDALRAGKIDGSVYEGDCACLIGTIANIRKVSRHDLGHGLVPDAIRPIERWFLAIRPGDTPATSQVAKITESWIVEFLDLLHGSAA